MSPSDEASDRRRGSRHSRASRADTGQRGRSVPRRTALETVGTLGLGALAGCLGREWLGGAGNSSGGGNSSDDELPPPSEVLHFSGGDAAAFQGALEDLADTPGALLEIESGTYEFDPRPTNGRTPYAHFELADFEDARIDGNGARLVFRDLTAGMFRPLLGSDLYLRNLELDYERPPFAQGTITELDSSEGALTLELEEGYPSLDHPTFDLALEVWASVHEPGGAFVSGAKKRSTLWKQFASMDHLGGREWRLVLDRPSTVQGLETGRRLAVLARGPRHAIAMLDVDGVTVRDVTIRSAIGMGMVIGNCADPVVEGLTIARPPDSDRLLSTNADGLHVYNCRGGPSIRNCHFERTQDDGIVVATTMATVSNVQGDRSVELVPRHKVDIGEGDVLEPMTTRGERRDPLPPVETVVTRSGGNSAPERIVFSEPVELSEGIHLANRDAATAGYEIRETTVRDVIARCVRIAAPQGRVVGNVFDGSSNPSVLVESYTGPIWAPWMWVGDLTIVDNEIRRSGLNGWANRRPSGILLHHKSPAGDVNTGRPHQGIRIVGNDIGPTGAEGLRLGDGRHLTVEHNEIEHPNRFEYEQLREEVGYGMGLENVGGAQIADNTVRGSVDELSAFAWGRRSDDISLSENRLEVDGTSIEPRFLRG